MAHANNNFMDYGIMQKLQRATNDEKTQLWLENLNLIDWDNKKSFYSSSSS